MSFFFSFSKKVLVLFSVSIITVIPVSLPIQAATSGQTTYYFHTEVADANTKYNHMGLSSPNSITGTTAATSTTNTNASPPTQLCEASKNTNTFTIVQTSLTTNNANRCLVSMISPPVGQTLNIATSDQDALSSQLYLSVSNIKVNIIPHIYIYRLSDTTLTHFATMDGTDPTTTSIAAQNYTATPFVNITFSPDDRFVAIVSMQVLSGASSGIQGLIYFDLTNADSFLKVNYTTTTKNGPVLNGIQDDAFAVDAICTNDCSYNTKWTYENGSANSSLNVHNTSSEWAILTNSLGANLGSNWGTSPTNSRLYQALPTGDFAMWTAVSSDVKCCGATPFHHGSLYLWASNTDFLEIQLFKNASNRGIQINNSGTLTGTRTVIAGKYNLIWLRWNKNVSSYQAQFSIDGITWTNLGKPIVHKGAFTRMGLSSFTSQINTATGWAFSFFKFLQSTSALGIDIVNANNITVANPKVTFPTKTFSFANITSATKLGTSAEKIQITAGQSTAWAVSIAASGGPTTGWSNGSGIKYDYNDTGAMDSITDTDTLGGKLTINPSTAVITALEGCTNTGLSLGKSSVFLEDKTNSITLISSTGSASACRWDLTGISMSQIIPSNVIAGIYTLNLTISII